MVRPQGRVRPCAAAAALMLVVLSLGVATPSLAEPGDHGKGAPGSAQNGAAQKPAVQKPAAEKPAAEKPAAEKPAAEKPAPEKAAPRSHEARTAKAPKGASATRPDFGDTTAPQPLSHADQNTGGANGQCPNGPYCSTRDGSASANGNGDGTAKGRPCAGCVGRADNKNPKGQRPDASDRNNGYECDGNKGIARGNPAHTACEAITPPPPPPDEVCVPKTGEDENCEAIVPPTVVPPTVVPPTVPPVVVAPVCVPVAGQDENCEVLGTEGERPSTEVNRPPVTSGQQPVAGDIAGVSAARPAAGVSTGALPATGASEALWLVALLGVGALVGGIALAGLRRRDDRV